MCPDMVLFSSSISTTKSSFSWAKTEQALSWLLLCKKNSCWRTSSVVKIHLWTVYIQKNLFVYTKLVKNFLCLLFLPIICVNFTFVHKICVFKNLFSNIDILSRVGIVEWSEGCHLSFCLSTIIIGWLVESFSWFLWVNEKEIVPLVLPLGLNKS